MLGLDELRHLAVDLAPRVDQVGGVELVAAVVALVAAGLGVAADGARAFDVAVRERPAGRRRDRALRRPLDHVAVAVHGAEHLLHDRVVVDGRGAGEQVVGQPEGVQVLHDHPVVRVRELARSDAGLVGGDQDRGAVLVGARHHEDVVPDHPHVAAEHVGGHAETGHVADVAWTVGVRPGDGGQDSCSWVEPSESGNPVAAPGRPLTGSRHDRPRGRPGDRGRDGLLRPGDGARAGLVGARRRTRVDLLGDDRAHRRRPVRLRRPGVAAASGARHLRAVREPSHVAVRTGLHDPRRAGARQRRPGAGARCQRRDARRPLARTRPADDPRRAPLRPLRPARLRGDGHRRDPPPPARRGGAAGHRLGPGSRRRTTRCWTGCSRTGAPTATRRADAAAAHGTRPVGTVGSPGGGTAGCPRTGPRTSRRARPRPRSRGRRSSAGRRRCPRGPGRTARRTPRSR